MTGPIYNFPTDALQIPGLVQGGLTIIIVASTLEARNYARFLGKKGLRARYVDGSLIHPLEHTDDMQYSDLDVLLFNASNSHQKVSTFLVSLRRPIAVLAIESAERASKLVRRHERFYLGWAQLRKLLRPRSLVCSTHIHSAEVVDEMQQIYELSKSSTIMVKDKLLSNLSIDAITLPRNHDKFGTILRLLEKRSGVTVILTATQMNAEDIAKKLKAEGYDAKALCLPYESTRGATRQELVAALSEASNEVLCVPKSIAIHLHLSNVRQIIWHSLAYSPQQFHAINKTTSQDGAAGHCTVLLSEQEIFNAVDTTLARSPSLNQMRLFMAEIFRGREVLQAGFSFVMEMMRARYLADLEHDDLDMLMHLFHDEGILCDRQTSYLHVNPGPRLQVSHQNLTHPMEFDLVRALEEAIGSRLDTRPGMLSIQLDALVESGLLQRKHERQDDPSGHGPKIFNVIKMDRDFSKREADDIIQKFSARMRAQTIGRINSRRQYFELFTTKGCFVASLAKAIHLDVPSEWKACGQCLFCVTHKPITVTPFSQIEKPVDLQRLDPIIRSVPAQFAKDPRFLTRLALGKLGTRVRALGLQHNRKVFGSMRLNSFEVSALLFLFFSAVLEFHFVTTEYLGYYDLLLYACKALLKAFAKRLGIPDSKLHEY